MKIPKLARLTTCSAFLLTLIAISISCSPSNSKSQVEEQKRLEAFMEHLVDLEGKPKREPVEYSVGTVDSCKPRTSQRDRGFSSFTADYSLDVKVDTQNYAYLCLLPFDRAIISQRISAVYIGLRISENGRQELLDLLLKAKAWYRKAREVNISVKNRQVGSTSDGIELSFEFDKDCDDLSGAISLNLPDSEKHFVTRTYNISPFHRSEWVKASTTLTLHFSPEAGCSIDKLITLLKTTPQKAANHFYAEQHFQ